MYRNLPYVTTLATLSWLCNELWLINHVADLSIRHREVLKVSLTLLRTVFIQRTNTFEKGSCGTISACAAFGDTLLSPCGTIFTLTRCWKGEFTLLAAISSSDVAQIHIFRRAFQITCGSYIDPNINQLTLKSCLGNQHIDRLQHY